MYTLNVLYLSCNILTHEHLFKSLSNKVLKVIIQYFLVNVYIKIFFLLDEEEQREYESFKRFISQQKERQQQKYEANQGDKEAHQGDKT